MDKSDYIWYVGWGSAIASVGILLIAWNQALVSLPAALSLWVAVLGAIAFGLALASGPEVTKNRAPLTSFGVALLVVGFTAFLSASGLINAITALALLIVGIGVGVIVFAKGTMTHTEG